MEGMEPFIATKQSHMLRTLGSTGKEAPGAAAQHAGAQFKSVAVPSVMPPEAARLSSASGGSPNDFLPR